MKKIITFLIAVTFFNASCTHEIMAPFENSNTINNSTTVAGNFILTKFTNKDNSEDDAIEFNEYVFTFSVDGKIVATKNNATALGTYTETYLYNGNPEKLGLYFSNKPLSNLNKSWHVNLISDAAIHLTDLSTGQILEFAAQ